MTTKSERREAKRKKQREGKLLRGNRSVFTMWLQTLRRNRYYKANTLDVFNLCKHGDEYPPYVRRK